MEEDYRRSGGHELPNPHRHYARLPVASAAPFRCGATVSPMAQTSQSEGHPTASHFRE